MKCSNCGTENLEEARLCESCGHQLEGGNLATFSEPTLTNPVLDPTPTPFKAPPDSDYNTVLVASEAAAVSLPSDPVLEAPDTVSTDMASSPAGSPKVTDGEPIAPSPAATSAEPSPLPKATVLGYGTPTTPHPVPDGFKFDVQSGLYYQSQMRSDTGGQQIQHVTYFNAATGKYVVARYPMGAAAPHQDLPPRNKFSAPIIVAIVAAAVVLLLTVFLFGSFLFGRVATTLNPITPPSTSSGQDGWQEQEEPSAVPEVDTFSGSDDESLPSFSLTKKLLDGSQSSVGYQIDVPNDIILNAYAEQDGDYLYYITDPNEHYSYQSIRRLHTTTLADEHIVSLSSTGVEGISAFTLTEDYIVFGIKGYSDCDYFVAKKDGSEVEHLLVGTRSDIIVNDGKLYFTSDYLNTIYEASWDDSSETVIVSPHIIGDTTTNFFSNYNSGIYNGDIFLSTIYDDDHSEILRVSTKTFEEESIFASQPGEEIYAYFIKDNTIYYQLVSYDPDLDSYFISEAYIMAAALDNPESATVVHVYSDPNNQDFLFTYRGDRGYFYDGDKSQLASFSLTDPAKLEYHGAISGLYEAVAPDWILTSSAITSLKTYETREIFRDDTAKPKLIIDESMLSSSTSSYFPDDDFLTGDFDYDEYFINSGIALLLDCTKDDHLASLAYMAGGMLEIAPIYYDTSSSVYAVGHWLQSETMREIFAPDDGKIEIDTLFPVLNMMIQSVPHSHFKYLVTVGAVPGVIVRGDDFYLDPDWKPENPITNVTVSDRNADSEDADYRENVLLIVTYANGDTKKLFVDYYAPGEDFFYEGGTNFMVVSIMNVD